MIWPGGGGVGTGIRAQAALNYFPCLLIVFRTSPVLFPGALEEPWRQYLSTTVAPSRCFLASFFFPPERPAHAFAFLPPARPYLEEPRNVIVHKGAEPLGISIVSGENGGIFVSKVTGGSIAHQAGLEYGDQLLEVRATGSVRKIPAAVKSGTSPMAPSFCVE